MIIEIESIADVVKLLGSDECNYFTCHRYGDFQRGKYTYHDEFNAHVEYRKDDLPYRRFCLRVQLFSQSTVIDITEVGDFDPRKDSYQTEYSRRTVRIENRRGRKPLLKFRDDLWTERSSYRSNGNAHSFTAFKREDDQFHIYGV